MKPLKSVKLIVIHCVANKCTVPFSVENLIACGKAKYGQCSYHYYVRYDGSVIPLLPESVQGVHARIVGHSELPHVAKKCPGDSGTCPLSPPSV